MTNEAIIKLTKSEITCILDAIKDYIQVIADEISDDWKYKDTIEYKAKSENLRFLKELQDKLLGQQDLLVSNVSTVAQKTTEQLYNDAEWELYDAEQNVKKLQEKRNQARREYKGR